MPERWKQIVRPLWCVLMALLVLAPALGPGFVLHLDMVFVPHQTLLPWNLGIGAGLPRSTPQDAIVSLLSGPFPGQLLQKAVLLASFILAGLGAARLSGPRMLPALAAASVYVWSPYVAGRLLIGHWGLLWAYALLPWVVIAARRAAVTRQWYPVVLLCGVGALVPTGGVMLALAGVPLAVGFSSALRLRSKVLLVSSVILLNAPWWLPAIRSEAAGVSDPLGLEVFGARADGPGGVLLSVLSGGGVWNAQAALVTRSTVLAAVAAVLLLVLAVVGYPVLLRSQRPEAVWLGILGVAGVLWAWISGIGFDLALAKALVADVPGGGLLRDGQKWTVYWVLLVALCAPLGVQRMTRRITAPVPATLGIALVVFPLAAMPDLAWGGLGRLHTADYPSSWASLRTVLADDPRTGDVVALPWTAFRKYPWNRNTAVLDPLPRYLTRTVVWNDALPVMLDGTLVSVGGDDPRASAITSAIGADRPLAEVLPVLGIRWAVVEPDQPAVDQKANLTGMRQVFSEAGTELWEVPAEPADRHVSDTLVVAVDALAILILTLLAVLWLRARRLDSRSG